MLSHVGQSLRATLEGSSDNFSGCTQGAPEQEIEE